MLGSAIALRPPLPADPAAIVLGMRAVELALHGAEITSQAWIELAWSAPGVDAAADVMVAAETDGAAVGAAWFGVPEGQEEQFASIAAFGDHAESAAGALAVWIKRRAAERGCTTLRVGALASQEPVERALDTAGMRPVRHFRLMVRRFAAPPQAPPAPAGITIADTLELPLDDAAVHAVLQAAFEDHWGGPFPDLEGFLHEIEGAGAREPRLWLAAYDEIGAVGALVAGPSFDEDPTLGYVHDLGVLRRGRGRGIGTALLETAFARLAEHGCAGCALYVDATSETGADRIYERAGMLAEDRFTTWMPAAASESAASAPDAR